MNILITRHDKIGDFVTALPMCKVLKEQTSHKVVMLVSKVNFDLAKKLEFIDDVILYSDDVLKLSKEIKKYRFDVSISAYIDTKLGMSLFLAGIKTRIAPATKIAQIFFNKTIKQKRSKVEKTEWMYNLDLVKYFESSIKTDFQRPLIDFGFVREDFIIFHVGSGGSSDGNLSIDDYISLAKKLSKVVDIVFSFGPDDAKDKKYIEKSIDFKATLRDDFASLFEFCEFIAKSKMFISTSTGPMHLAALSNTPTFSFFGSNLFASSKRWASINDVKLQHNFEVPTPYSREFYDSVENKLYNTILEGKSSEV